MSIRNTPFDVWKKGELVKAWLRYDEKFKPGKIHEPITPDRVVGVDTESFQVKAKRFRRNPTGLKTLLIPVALPKTDDPEASETIVLETPDGTGLLEQLFGLLSKRFGEDAKSLYDVLQQTGTRKRMRAGPKNDVDEPRSEKVETQVVVHTRTQKLQPIILPFYNLEYDIGRLLADRQYAALGMLSGSDTYRLRIGTRFILEVVNTRITSAASSFEWIVFDRPKRKAFRCLGTDVFGYWKGGLNKTAKSLLNAKKLDITDQIPGVFERTRESFTTEEWDLIKKYAAHDADLTRLIYIKTIRLLRELSPAVIKSDGTIPQSMPGATARMAWAESFECHPEFGAEAPTRNDVGWERANSHADQLGASSYGGGLFFSPRPGIYKHMVSVDLKSAYPNVECRLPDPVKLMCIFPIKIKNGAKVPIPFDLEMWKGKWGCVVIDGEGLDDIYPPIRIHDPEADGRLRYVYGPFTKRHTTIPEMVLGVLSGRLRVDKIHDAVIMQEWDWDAIAQKRVVCEPRPKNSFLYTFTKKMFDKKENDPNEPLRALAKLAIVSLYGKKAEVNDWSATLDSITASTPTFEFKAWEKVAKTLLRLYAENGPHDPFRAEYAQLYFGPQETSFEAKLYYRKLMHRYRSKKPLERSCAAVTSYVATLARFKEDRDGDTQIPVSRFLARPSYRCGFYWTGLYASQITGMTAAMLGLMASCTNALQGDTDSAHVIVPDHITYETIGQRKKNKDGSEFVQPDNVPGFNEYFEIMTQGGYESTRLVDGEWRGGVPGCDALGAWAVENVPSDESVLAMIKTYSHKYTQGGKVKFKQAKHALPQTTDLIAEKLKQKKVLPMGDRKALATFATKDVADKLLARRPLDDDQRLALADSAIKQALHEGLKNMLDSQTISLPRRATPLRLRRAIKSHREFGEFMRDMQSSRGIVANPSQWTDDEGWVRWRRLDGTRSIDPQ